jgi:NADH:ubiquinone reductase (H+-translocating)
MEDALEIRRRILGAFEAAEREATLEGQEGWLTFVVVGGGPTGVELAGALAELSHHTLKNEFRCIDTTRTRILLLEAMERVLPPYPPSLSAKAARSLEKRGVTIWTDTMVTDVDDESVTIRRDDETERIPTRTVLWAAGMRATPIGPVLGERTGVELDRRERVMVERDLSIAGYPDIFVIGDLAHFVQDGEPLPQLAPVAMQQGEYVANLIKARSEGQDMPPFRYRDKGSLVVIARNAAIAELGRFKLSGFPAWLLWVFVHIAYLIEFDNKVLVMIQWAWNYFTRERGTRLIIDGLHRD